MPGKQPHVAGMGPNQKAPSRQNTEKEATECKRVYPLDALKARRGHLKQSRFQGIFYIIHISKAQPKASAGAT